MGPPDMTGLRAVRFNIAESLGMIGEPARAAMPKLTAMMAGDADPEVRVSTALAVYRIDPPNKRAFAQLVRLLEDECGGAGGGLRAGQLGPAARGAVPASERRVTHEYEFVRSNAADALGEIGGEEVVPHLVFAMRNPPCDGPPRRRRVARQVRRCGRSSGARPGKKSSRATTTIS